MQHYPPESADDRSGLNRRSLITKGAVAGGTLWIAPAILSVSPAAASLPFGYIVGSEAYGIAGPHLGTGGGGTKTITLTSAGVTPGDLWIGIVAYSGAADASVTNTAGGVTMSPFQRQDGGADIYSVGASVVYKKLTAADISGGSFSATFQTSNNNALYGDIRGSAVAYGGANVVGAVATTKGMSADTATTATVTFPAATGAPVSTPNVVLHLGAARGYGGWNAFFPTIEWTSAPGTERVDFHGGYGGHEGNLGDRALVISEEADSTGSSTSSGTIYGQSRTFIVSVSDFRNWVTFTVVVKPG